MRLVVALTFGSLFRGYGVRLTDADSDGTEEECTAELKVIYTKMTVQRLFKPLLDGTYRLRNRYTGKYLTAADDDTLGTTRAYTDDSHISEWEIRRSEVFLKVKTPLYTMRSHKSKKYLTVNGMSKMLASYSFDLDATGIYFSVAQGDWNFLTENFTSNLVSFMPKVSEEVNAEYLNWRTFWELEIVGRPYGRIRPRSAKGEYEWQWTQASNIPMWTGSPYTWQDMCTEIGEESVCPKGYAGVRESLQAAGLISENGGNNVVTENHIKSCHTPVTLERQRFQLPGLVQALKDTAGAACHNFNLQTVSSLMRLAIQADCYETCQLQIRDRIGVLDCTTGSVETWTEIFASLRDTTSCNLPPPTLLYLAEFEMQQKCFTWAIPYPLWIPNDRGPGVTNLARSDGDAVCVMASGKESSRNDANIQQTGSCIEGTQCECPETWITSHESLAAMRQTNFGESFGDNAGANFFVADYGSAFAGVTSTMARSLAIGSVVQVAIFGLNPLAAILATPFGIPFIAQTSLALFNFGRDGIKWSCGEVVGCWPVEPKRINGKCRIPDATKVGGSKVWFMPPPGFYLKHKTWRASKCSLETCAKKDLIKERVEFNKREVYNCQFMAYDDMTADQQSKYLQRLRMTIPAEYAGEI